MLLLWCLGYWARAGTGVSTLGLALELFWSGCWLFPNFGNGGGDGDGSCRASVALSMVMDMPFGMLRPLGGATTWLVDCDFLDDDRATEVEGQLLENVNKLGPTFSDKTTDQRQKMGKTNLFVQRSETATEALWLKLAFASVGVHVGDGLVGTRESDIVVGDGRDLVTVWNRVYDVGASCRGSSSNGKHNEAGESSKVCHFGGRWCLFTELCC